MTAAGSSSTARCIAAIAAENRAVNSWLFQSDVFVVAVAVVVFYTCKICCFEFGFVFFVFENLFFFFGGELSYGVKKVGF